MKRLVYLFIILILFIIYTTSGYARSGIGLIKVIESDGSPEAYVNTIVVGDGDLSATGAQATIQTSGGTSTEQTITVTDTGEDTTKGEGSYTPTDGFLIEIVKIDCQDDDGCNVGFTETGDEDEGDKAIFWNTGAYNSTITEDADTVHIPLENITLKQSETKEFFRGTVKWLTNAETQISKFQGINLGKGVVTGARKGLAKSTSYTLSASVDDNEMNSTVVVDTADVVIGIPADQCDTATHQTVCVTKTTASTVSLKSFDAVDKFTIPGSLLDAGDEVDLAAAIYSSVCYECIAPNVWGLVNFSGTPTDGGAETTLLSDANCQGVWYFENDATDSSSGGNNLTAVNAPTYETTDPAPEQGTYSTLCVAASDQRFSSASTDFDVTGNFSIGGFFRIDGDSWNGFIGKAAAGDYAFYLARNNSSNSADVGVSSDGTNWITANAADDTFAINTWYHLAVVYNGTEVKLYTDGTEYTTSGFPISHVAGINDSVGDFYVGYVESESYKLNGNADAVFFFNRALSAEEVAQFAAGTE